MTLTIKIANDGNSRLFQINGRGPWRTEYKTDSLVPNGEHDVTENGKVVGKWIQDTTGHQIIS